MNNLPSRYEAIQSPLCGGFGAVYICRDRQLERKVAIKFIKNVGEEGRLKDEFLALMRLRSKHVVQLYDVICGEDNSYGLVQEYVEGSDLRDSSDPRKSQRDYLMAIWQIASGIADIHAAGVIHRDIKPNNMKISAEGVIKIFDFGLSRSEGVNSRTEGFKGTHGFAAPELYANGQCIFSQAVDTYAFAATALFLAVGPAISQLNASGFDGVSLVPHDLIHLLKSCFDAAPNVRPQMVTLRDEFAKHLLFNKHQAIAVVGGRPCVLNAKERAVTLEMGAHGKIRIEYNGMMFIVTYVEGAVYINAAEARVGQFMPGSCVITFGVNGGSRGFVPFDVSNPEVVI